MAPVPSGAGGRGPLVRGSGALSSVFESASIWAPLKGSIRVSFKGSIRVLIRDLREFYRRGVELSNLKLWLL